MSNLKEKEQSMKKWIICILIFVVIVFGGIGTYLLTFDINAYRADVEKKLTQLIGQPVKVGGNLFMEKSFEPTLILQDVSVRDPLDESKEVFTAKEVLIQFDLLSYFKNVYAVSTMHLTGGQLNLLKNKAGQDNWSFVFAAHPYRNIDETHLFSLNHFKANSLGITYTDEHKDKQYKIDFSRMTLEQLVNLEGNFVFEAEKGTLKGSFMNLQEALSGAGKLEFVLDIMAYNMQTTYSCVIPDLSKMSERTLNLQIGRAHV